MCEQTNVFQGLSLFLPDNNMYVIICTLNNNNVHLFRIVLFPRTEPETNFATKMSINVNVVRKTNLVKYVREC